MHRASKRRRPGTVPLDHRRFPFPPAVAIVLTNCVNGSPADVDAIAGLVANGAVNTFTPMTSMGTFEPLVTSGAEIVSESTEQPWGARDCAVRDPSGNLLASTSRPPADASRLGLIKSPSPCQLTRDGAVPDERQITIADKECLWPPRS